MDYLGGYRPSRHTLGGPRLTGEEWLVIISVIGCLAGFGVPLVGGWMASAVGRECLLLGYRDSTVTWLGYGDAYCINRQDQTDVVTPLAKARRKPLVAE